MGAPSEAGAVRRVLAIDEDAAARRQLAELLQAEGFEVAEAGGATAGLFQMGSAGPDLVFVELYMADVDGLEFLRMARQSHPGVPVVVLSEPSRPGFDALGTVAVHLGARAVMSKPVTAANLRAVVDGLPSA